MVVVFVVMIFNVISNANKQSVNSEYVFPKVLPAVFHIDFILTELNTMHTTISQFSRQNSFIL